MRRLIHWAVLYGVVAVWCVAVVTPTAADQPAKDEAKLGGSVVAGGLSKFSIDRWGLVKAIVVNESNTDGEFRVTWAFDAAPQRQFVRRVWVPASARRTVLWPARLGEVARTGKKIEVAEGRAILLHNEREVTYSEQPGSIMVDAESWPTVVVAASEDDAAHDGVTSVRESVTASTRLTIPIGGNRALPRFTLGWQPVDVAVLADPNLELDPAQRRALRRWLRAGGTVWVMADRVAASTIEQILGEDWRVGEVDRLSVVRAEVQRGPDAEAGLMRRGRTDAAEPMRHEPVEVEQPIDFVRVDAPAYQQLLTMRGWPVLLQRRVGAGRVIVTTLGSRSWTDERAEAINYAIAQTVYSRDDAGDLEAFEPGVADELTGSYIGYRVASRSSVTAVLMSYLLLFIGFGVLWWRRGCGERIGPTALILAGAAALTLGALGYVQRGKAESTNAVVQLVHVEDGSVAATVRGTMEMFAPFGRQAELASKRGGFAWPRGGDETGTLRRLMWSDLDHWRWVDLELSGGASQYADFHTTAELDAPLDATFRFTGQGLAASLRWPEGMQPTDAVVATSRAALGATLSATDQAPLRCTVAGDAVLPKGNFIPDAVMSDRQRRRNEFMAQLAGRPQPDRAGKWPGRPLFLAWTDPIDAGFEPEPGVERRGAALWVVPLHIEPASPGQRVRIPWPLIEMRPVRDLEGVDIGALLYDQRKGEWLSVSDARTFGARFELPEAAAPLRPERVALTLDISAIGRTVRILGFAGGEPTTLATLDSPDGPQRITLPVDRLPRPLSRITLAVDVSGFNDPQRTLDSQSSLWQIHRMTLDVEGVVAPEPTETAP